MMRMAIYFGSDATTDRAIDVDVAFALAVDSQGNVYVTGRSWGGTSTLDDYATVKYDANGNLLWVRRYNGPGNRSDEARALAVDSQGNVYVTGSSIGAGTSVDYATVKYDANGNLLWVRRYNGPDNSLDEAFALAVDNQGNVYVTGFSRSDSTLDDYATVKYDANGNLLWVRRYNGPDNGVDVAVALAVDSQGNVYVTGSSWGGTSTHYDYATVKYDANGNLLWVRRYNGPGNWSDVAFALAVDSQGNVYVTGRSWGGTSTLDDYATVKYDANGNLLWVTRYNGPGNGFDEARALAVDGQGNVYVTGSSIGAGTSVDYATVKYDANGNLLWVTRYNGPGNGFDEARALAVDGQGNVYVTGQSWGGDGTDYDYATVKYVQCVAGDVNCDGCVDDADLLAVLFAFGNRGSDLPEDLNGDGVVDAADLQDALSEFGRGCQNPPSSVPSLSSLLERRSGTSQR
jgi:uncharacterized delta-60 repeat protein